MKTNDHIKIFIADKKPSYINLYINGLNNLGYQDITSFTSSEDCIKALSQKPAIIFLDHRMDKHHVSETLKTIKLIDPNILVVITIDPKEIQTNINTSNYGIYDYIFKGKEDLMKIAEILSNVEQKLNSPIKKLIKLFML